MKRIILGLIVVLNAFWAGAADIKLADPTIFYEDGVYYLTGTLEADGFKMYKSTDLVHWTVCGNATNGLALYKDDVFGTQWFWAPQIFKNGNSYYMAYSANELIAIARGNSPMGPFKQTVKAELPHDTGQIDPFVFVDDDGKNYMYYVRFDGGNTLYVCELTSDFSTIKSGTVTRCLGADKTWETRQGKITEGPTMFKDGDYYYLIYSANHYESIDYAVGYAYSTSPKGPWTKVDKPFISRHNMGINGTGHGDLFQGADGQWYYVFHVHASNHAVQTRRTAIVPITIGDKPTRKFIPEVDRMFILDDAASSTATMPQNATYFDSDGIDYFLPATGAQTAHVTFSDLISFGGHRGTVTVPDEVEYDGTTYEVTHIGHNAFYYCTSMRKVEIGANVTTIEVSAFEKTGLTEVSLPRTVSKVEYRAFADCSKLASITVNRPAPPTLDSEAFDENTYATATLYVPQGKANRYASASGWKKFQNIVEKEDTAIDGPSADENTDDGEAYDLQGRKVLTNQPGVIIRNGKKYIKR